MHLSQIHDHTRLDWHCTYRAPKVRSCVAEGLCDAASEMACHCSRSVLYFEKGLSRRRCSPSPSCYHCMLYNGLVYGTAYFTRSQVKFVHKGPEANSLKEPEKRIEGNRRRSKVRAFNRDVYM